MRCRVCHRRLLADAACPVDPAERGPATPAPSAEPPALPGYHGWRLLGGGGFAQVFAAQHAGREVAVKVASRRGDPRFAAEAEALRKVGPPHAPALSDHGVTDDGRPYLVLELVAGPSLAEWLAARPAYPPPATAIEALAVRLARALDGVHAAGVVHRDFKPENVLLRGDDAVLIDFGLAPGGGDAELTSTGQLLGTPSYLAPEQAADARNADRRSDLYALAAVLFEAITGRPPFVGEPAEIVQAHVARRPPRISELAAVPAALDAVFARALAKDPAARFQDAATLAAAVAHGLAAPQAATPEPAAAERTRTLVALLALWGRVPVWRLNPVAAETGGRIARAGGDACQVIAFDAATPAAAVRAALRCAERLAGLATGAVVHLADARVRAGAAGPSIWSAAVAHADEWAAPAREGGLLVTPEAAARLETTALSPAAGGYFTPAPPSAPEQLIAPSLQERVALLADARAEGAACLATSTPTLTTIVGTPGTGKSAVLAEIAATAQALGFDVERLVPTGSGAGEDARQLLALGLNTPPADYLSLADASRRHAAARATAALLRARAAVRPLAILVDDAHRADPGALDALELATIAAGEDQTAAPGTPLWIVAAAGPELATLRHGWADRAARTRTFELAPLSVTGARALFAELLRPVEFVPQAVVARLHALCGGVPTQLVEVARALRAAGAVRRLTGTDAWFLAADELLSAASTDLGRRLATRALGALPPALRSFALLCAVIGEPLHADELAAIQRALGDDPAAEVDAAVALARLVRQSILVATLTGFAFRVRLVRDGIDALTPAATARRYHQAAHTMLLERVGGGPVEHARRARHATGCARPAEAAADWLAAGDGFLAVHQDLDAEQAFTAALATLDPADASRHAQALFGRGRAWARLRRTADAIRDLREARALATTAGDHARVIELLLEEATLRDWDFEFAESERLAGEAAAHATSLGDARLSARCDVAVGRTHFRAERFDEAITTLTRASQAAAALGDEETRVLALLLLAPSLVPADRLDDAEACFAEAIALCERTGDILHLGVAHANRMWLWWKRGLRDRELADGRRAVELARESGNVAVERVAEYNVAELLLGRGEHVEALARARRALDLARRFYTQPWPQDALLCARLHVARGERDEAMTHLDWIARTCPPEMLSPSLAVLARMARLACAPAIDERAWRALLADAGRDSIVDEQLEVLGVCAATARAAGNDALAAEADRLRASIVANDRPAQ